jgi:hypothetical protein
MTKRQWSGRGNGIAREHVRTGPHLKEAVKVSRQINWRVKMERTQNAAVARETHLRALMGLPARRPGDDED